MGTNLKGIARAIGAAAGVAAGAAAALVGKRLSKVDPAAEELYWREHYAAEAYFDAKFGFEDYLPAWRTGWEGAARHPGRNFEDLEHDLKTEFHWNRGQSRLLWEQARPAARAAWNRI